MEKFTYYQGDDIPVQIELFEDDAQTIPVNLDLLSDLIVYVYTDGRKIVKASMTERTGYVKMGKTDSFRRSFIIDSAKTKLMEPGRIMVEINTINSAVDLVDMKMNKIGIGAIGLLNKSLIKVES